MLLVFHLHAIGCPSISFESGVRLSFRKRIRLLADQFSSSSSPKQQQHKRSSSKSNLIRAASPAVEQATCFQTWEEDVQDFSLGPMAGDLAEIEAFCRIQRLAEQLHKSVMESLRSLESIDDESAFSSSLEEKVVAGLACIGATLQQGRLEVLGGSSSEEDDERLPRLARFRSKLRDCCKSVRTSLQSLLAAKGEQNLMVYRILQRLINVCLDAGFHRPEGAPDHGHIPNFGTVSLSSVKGEDGNEVEFWRGGQMTEEGLEWILSSGFKTIVDIRAEVPENDLAEAALVEAEAAGKIKRIRIPVQRETAPTMEQVQTFARIVSDPSNKRLLLQSYAGVVRPSAMISRWREFVLRGGLECDEEEECSTEELFQDPNTIIVEESDQKSSEMAGRSFILSPFQAQMPVRDIFSRKDMSSFFKSRRIVPKFAEYKTVCFPASNSSSKADEAANGSLGSSSSKRSSSNGGLRTDIQGSEEVIEGNMCASKTGVVRLQSRKKAEMYLVRADGFSCTRERVTESTLAFTHPSTQQQMLMWKTAPKTALLLKKLGDELMEEAKLVASFLYHQEGMNVMVEPDVHDQFARYPGFGYVQTFYNHDIGELHERVDFVVCLGGDGVILHASNLFRSSVPPVVSFNLGSLGFLTAHPFEDYKQDLRAIIHGNRRIEGVYVTLRMRLRCEIMRDGQPVPGKVFEVLNEVVVDRGSNPYLCKIECYERNRLITKVQADGVLVATPTGSTAYSTAAGGSMVHPNVPCMLFTPICPHSLSFRPVILPDSAILELKVPDDARSSAFVSFDGKFKHPLKLGESIRIRMSEHPMSTVNKRDQTDDWFASLSRCFGWNQRAEQKSL